MYCTSGCDTILLGNFLCLGTPILTLTARDRDSGDFGTAGLRYELTGATASLFSLDPASGAISVAPCPTPGTGACLDYEQVRHHFLSYAAADLNGAGRRSVVNLRISVEDDNDNAPVFEAHEYRASIDEGEAAFSPRLILKATDRDESSRLVYRIAEGNTNELFRIDADSGEISVAAAGEAAGLRLDNIPTDKILLEVEVTDGVAVDRAVVEIIVKDVNDRPPIFEKAEYVAAIPEDSEPGIVVEQVHATDADFGANAELTYRIAQGAYDDFSIEPKSGEVRLTRRLNFDTRQSYEIEIVAVDGGDPSLTGENCCFVFE
jgi:Cadherin domain